MSDSALEFTGERFVPGVAGEIVYEHVHRYAFARELVSGKRVLDAACGEGYGSALLATQAATVTGIDLDAATIAHASARYGGIATLGFAVASVTHLPLADASVDVVVSFETIEHLPAEDQPRMLAEFARVLAPGGLLVISAPNRVEYSERRGYVNPFHRKEHDREELDALLARAFGARAFYRQRLWMGSTIWREDGNRSTVKAQTGDFDAVIDAPLPDAMYYIVTAAASATMLPSTVAATWLFCDAAQTELERAHRDAREAVRLDAILGERTAMLDRKTAHVEHLESLVAFREGIIVERDGQVQQLSARNVDIEQQAAALHSRVIELDANVADLVARLAESQSVVMAQERIIEFRRHWRWWAMLPLLKLRGAWHRIRGQ
ncbi:MAG TPA: methyltransferase domain-containing protein [Casimicrobiaceae bacterium]|nr:methyltransferase domain-containing protein [Casimicrobiaceae bacterium]